MIVESVTLGKVFNWLRPLVDKIYFPPQMLHLGRERTTFETGTHSEVKWCWITSWLDSHLSLWVWSSPSSWWIRDCSGYFLSEVGQTFECLVTLLEVFLVLERRMLSIGEFREYFLFVDSRSSHYIVQSKKVSAHGLMDAWNYGLFPETLLSTTHLPCKFDFLLYACYRSNLSFLNTLIWFINE